MTTWRGGTYLNAPDDELLRAAHAEGRALVTFDVSTIPAQLKRLTEAGIDHSGVVFVSRSTSDRQDIGGLIRSLQRFLAAHGTEEMRNQVRFLPRA